MYATGTFTLDTWNPLEEAATAVDGVTVGSTEITKTFTGGLAGTSAFTMHFVVSPVQESSAYNAFERFTGSLDGREGTFVLQHFANADIHNVTVVRDSGTGDLKGLTGALRITRTEDGTHEYSLEYSL